jgi:hypothetical protein
MARYIVEPEGEHAAAVAHVRRMSDCGSLSPPSVCASPLLVSISTRAACRSLASSCSRPASSGVTARTRLSDEIAEVISGVKLSGGKGTSASVVDLVDEGAWSAVARVADVLSLRHEARLKGLMRVARPVPKPVPMLCMKDGRVGHTSEWFECVELDDVDERSDGSGAEGTTTSAAPVGSSSADEGWFARSGGSSSGLAACNAASHVSGLVCELDGTRTVVAA